MAESKCRLTAADELLSALRVGGLLVSPLPAAVLVISKVREGPPEPNLLIFAGIQVLGLSMLMLAFRFDNDSGLTPTRAILVALLFFVLYTVGGLLPVITAA